MFMVPSRSCAAQNFVSVVCFWKLLGWEELFWGPATFFWGGEKRMHGSKNELKMFIPVWMTHKGIHLAENLGFCISLPSLQCVCWCREHSGEDSGWCCDLLISFILGLWLESRCTSPDLELPNLTPVLCCFSAVSLFLPSSSFTLQEKNLHGVVIKLQVTVDHFLWVRGLLSW